MRAFCSVPADPHLPISAAAATKNVRPLLKWAGGKSRLLPQFAPHFPPALAQGEIKRVVEPFVGSGAVGFHLLQNYPVTEVVLNDANPEIIRLYRVLQVAPDILIERLGALQANYLKLDEAARRAFYYEIRTRYNQQRREMDPLTDSAIDRSLRSAHSVPDVWIQRAGWTVFLNKTCFNGLFRVNGKGEFNVPFGRYERPAICHEENLRAAARLLEQATLLCGDYGEVERWVTESTFVYFDPPYRPLSRTAGFTAYAPGGFDEHQQERLARFFRRLHHQTGAWLMLSNSDPGNVDPRDDFFQRLYAGFHLHRVHAERMINANASRRGKITELLITNYE